MPFKWVIVGGYTVKTEKKTFWSQAAPTLPWDQNVSDVANFLPHSLCLLNCITMASYVWKWPSKTINFGPAHQPWCLWHASVIGNKINTYFSHAFHYVHLAVYELLDTRHVAFFVLIFNIVSSTACIINVLN